MEEPVRRARQERWQTFRPSTRCSLERLEALAGARLAEELAEANWREHWWQIGSPKEA